MLSFNPITIADKEVITAYTRSGNFQNCDFAFSNMCSWRFLFDTEFAIEDNFLFIRFYLKGTNKRHQAYMFPVGTGDLKQAIEKLEQDASEKNQPLCMLGVVPYGKNMLENLFPEEFTFTQERNHFDYIYLREKLLTLTGKKLQPKRNHINKFTKKYAFTYLPITRAIIPECLELANKWRKVSHTEEIAEDLKFENRSVSFALNNFDALDLTGGAIQVENQIVAFTYGSPVNQHTFGVHVEKADIRYDGIFSMINREFVARIPERYIFINREEDLGLPGLRQSKLSYQPTILLEKNRALKRYQYETYETADYRPVENIVRRPGRLYPTFF
jgi:hypothetical protein